MHSLVFTQRRCRLPIRSLAARFHPPLLCTSFLFDIICSSSPGDWSCLVGSARVGVVEPVDGCPMTAAPYKLPPITLRTCTFSY
ncbi:hypothetical protein BO83DRAFT_23389 [Aspergillus eucalypticola CBS 122712]|uniref:Uncharacterized protein n=1 Tax=Aspergillus eucalypticola (strain CBS 122712 / IBT 29274) TaxID=1448314 RepID=A0A317VJA6_ASPEC|nr:uncharacterized protein BO83DRAFT_23389 [Aspergillus eucalypticola CBS 122712]PWY74005.1 hypothetical protein BO83DRAFT_23389 [Aspergillus eucalypticola CBS 122712]